MNLESYVLMLQGTLQQFVDDFFRCVLCSGNVVPPAVKYFFDFLDEQAEKHDNVDEETIHIWKTNRYETYFYEECVSCNEIQWSMKQHWTHIMLYYIIIYI